MFIDSNDFSLKNVFLMWSSINETLNFLQRNQLDAPISQIYSWNKTLHVSDSSSVHHQEFFTVHTSVVDSLHASCQQTCMT